MGTPGHIMMMYITPRVPDIKWRAAGRGDTLKGGSPTGVHPDRLQAKEPKTPGPDGAAPTQCGKSPMEVKPVGVTGLRHPS